MRHAIRPGQGFATTGRGKESELILRSRMWCTSLLSEFIAQKFPITTDLKLTPDGSEYEDAMLTND